MSAESDVVAAAWFADPYRRGELRYFDGSRWTEHVATNGEQSLAPLDYARLDRERPPATTESPEELTPHAPSAWEEVRERVTEGFGIVLFPLFLITTPIWGYVLMGCLFSGVFDDTRFGGKRWVRWAMGALWPVVLPVLGTVALVLSVFSGGSVRDGAWIEDGGEFDG